MTRVAKTEVGELFVASISGGADFQATESISRHAPWRLADDLVHPVLEQAIVPRGSVAATDGIVRWQSDENARANLHPEAGEKGKKLRRSAH